MLILLNFCLLSGMFGCMKDAGTAWEAATTSAVADESSDMAEESSTSVKKDVPVEDEKRGNGSIIDIYGEGDAARLGVSKTLVWIVPGGKSAKCPTKAAVGRLNELLVNEYGCDFVVEFHTYSGTMSIKNPDYTYYDMVLDMRELGHQADILYSGNADEYQGFLDAGIYEPFTEFFLTAEGQELYNAYAGEIWKKTERDGEVYGYASLTYPGAVAVSICNNVLAEKYGIKTGEEWSFYDMESLMENVSMAEGDKISEKIIPVYCDQYALMIMEGYYTDFAISEAILFKEDAEYGCLAVNPAKEERLIKLWKKIKEYKDNGWYATSGEYGAVTLAGMGNFLFSFNCHFTTSLVGNTLVLSDDTLCDVSVGSVSYEMNDLMTNMVTGVTAWSEHKEDAFRLIRLIQTESELSNLLYYGVEGEDYIFYDGIPMTPDGKDYTDLPVIFADNVNINLLYSVLADPEDKAVYSKKMSENFVDGASMMYDIDMTGRYEQQQLSNLYDIYSQYMEILFAGTSDDVEATVTEMNEKLSAEGLDEIIEDINRQIKNQGKVRENG